MKKPGSRDGGKTDNKYDNMFCYCYTHSFEEEKQEAQLMIEEPTINLGKCLRRRKIKMRSNSINWRQNSLTLLSFLRGGDKSAFLYHCYPDGRGPNEDLINMLENDVIDKNPNVKFEDIADLDEAKNIIQETVLLPLLMPEFFKVWMFYTYTFI